MEAAPSKPKQCSLTRLLSKLWFFADTDMVELPPDMKELFDCWVCLTPSQKAAAIQMLKAMSLDNE